MSNRDKYPWVWDVDMDKATFERILNGGTERPGYDWVWAMVRLVEYASWADIRELLPRDRFLAHWPEVAPRVRSDMSREGMDFVHAKLLARQQAR